MSKVISELAAKLNLAEGSVSEVYEAGRAAGRESILRGVKPNAGAIHEQLGLDMYRRAYEEGMSLSAWLEKEDPSAEYTDGMDAFQRQMAIADIRDTGDYYRGIPAHTMDRFWKATSTSSALLPEWLCRQWRMPRQKRFYLSTSPASDVLNPAYIQQGIRAKQLAPSILDDLIALRTGVDTDTYKAFYLTDSQDNRREKRVTEGGGFASAKLTGSDHTINLYKFGRELDISYEAMRRISIDRMAFHIGQISMQTENDKAQWALAVASDGDGNSNAATSTAVTGLTGGIVNTIKFKPWLDFWMLFESPYKPNVVVAQSAGILELFAMDAGTGNFLIYLANQGQHAAIGSITMPEGPVFGFNAYWRSYMETKKVVVLDNRYCLEMLYEVGADLVETDRLISHQFEKVVISEAMGFCKLDNNACRVLDWGS
jgi:hypothetical protein